MAGERGAATQPAEDPRTPAENTVDAIDPSPGQHHGRGARPTGPALRRERRSGPLNAMLQSLIDAGDLLAIEADTLGADERWQERRRAWRREASQTIHTHFEQEAASEFLYATRIRRNPDASRAGQTEQVRATRNGAELLASLRSTLGGQGSPH